MTDSLLLGLPYLDAAQSQKHITHNEALSRLDLSVQIALTAMNVTTASSSPAEGERCHVGAGATGAFAGQSGKIAARQDGAWRFLVPQSGWIAWVDGTHDLLIYDGSVWQNVAISIHDLQNLTTLGLGTSADVSNPLSVKLNSALFTARAAAEGGTGDLRFNLNKSLASGALSQLYQVNYSARAETGLLGDDHFRIKVSPDGSAWTTSMDVDPSTGKVSFPSGLAGAGAGLSFRRLETFDTSGTFTKQAGDVLYFAVAIGGGGGGGSGRRSAAATQAGGGAGGNGAHTVEEWVPASSVSSSSSVTVGAGGAGAASVAASTNGGSGGTGGSSIIFNLFARGGAGGTGGTSTAGGTAQSASVDAYTASRFRESGGGAGGAAATGSGSSHAGGSSGGGGGAGLTTADVEASGATAGTGDQTSLLATTQGGAGGTTAAPNGSNALSPPSGRFGSGGGGGASKAAVAAGNGGMGSQAGGGGGGGGGGRNGLTGGAGGNGGAGRVLIYVFG